MLLKHNNNNNNNNNNNFFSKNIFKLFFLILKMARGDSEQRNKRKIRKKIEKNILIKKAEDKEP